MSELKKIEPITILMADDDLDDQLMAKEAFEENRMANSLKFVNDGEELLDYLNKRGKYNESNAPRPGLVLLDLNMPKMDGRTALTEIKKNPNLRRIPIVILTTSKSEEDVIKSYDLGVSSFITKPVSFNDLVAVTKEIGRFWFGIVVLPKDDNTIE
ncbi:response regulator [Fulvivirga sp.]|uniref:response regulator n=1 Tax=Fulvivirga sp. TaxID=1931237 RepID=UPI0032EB579A